MTEAVAPTADPARAILAMLAIAVFGLALIVAGVWVLAGLGWALVASGSGLLAFAGVIRRGVFRIG
jgi:hypothetical protein